MIANGQIFQLMKRTAVVDDIIESIKQALIKGDLHPGQRLPSESEFTEQFNVGRGTVREAMKMLSALGVVEIRRGDGTYIADKPSAAQLSPLLFSILLQRGNDKELFELRVLIEIGYCQLATDNATEEDLKQIQKAEEGWEAYVSSNNVNIDNLLQIDLNFHFALLEATHNPLVITIGRSVEELFLNCFRKSLIKKEVREWGGHRAIIEALLKRDKESVRQAVVYSLQLYKDEVWGEA